MSTLEKVTIAAAYYNQAGRVIKECTLEMSPDAWGQIAAGGKLVELGEVPEGAEQVIYYNDATGETYDHSC